jgi:hypothetical protein
MGWHHTAVILCRPEEDDTSVPQSFPITSPKKAVYDHRPLCIIGNQPKKKEKKSKNEKGIKIVQIPLSAHMVKYRSKKKFHTRRPFTRIESLWL